MILFYLLLAVQVAAFFVAIRGLLIMWRERRLRLVDRKAQRRVFSRQRDPQRPEH